jgi:hypothetical protein
MFHPMVAHGMTAALVSVVIMTTKILLLITYVVHAQVDTLQHVLYLQEC